MTEVERFVIVRYPLKLSFDKYGKREGIMVTAGGKIYNEAPEAEKKCEDMRVRFGSLYRYEVAMVVMSDGN